MKNSEEIVAMNIRNVKKLGKKTEDLLVFGGVYSNLGALQALLQIIDERNIPDENVICTGDIVAYCAHPNEVCELLYKRNFNFIKGNCEESLAENKEDCGCGFGEGTNCDLLSKKWYDFAKKELNPKYLSWFAGMANIMEFEYYGKKCLIFHGGIFENNKFIFPSTSKEHKKSEMDKYMVDMYICGHSGIPFTEKIEDKIWHNAGVIGMPANDGTSEVFYSIISSDFHKIVISHERLKYDIDLEIKKMREVGLDIGYDKSLSSGIWPSFEVLPEYEIANHGKKLKLDKIYIEV